MYKTCPKCGYKRRPGDAAPKGRCPGCGLVFRKWLKSLVADDDSLPIEQAAATTVGWRDALTATLIQIRPGVAIDLFRGSLELISMDFQSNAIWQSWLHKVDLVIHEAGHVIFGPFGRFVSILGGSLLQVLMPLILLFGFLLYNRDAFAASICLWWTGQSIMDVAPYIADARALRMPLLGGGTGADNPGMHDWANLLRSLGWLQYDIQIAYGAKLIGAGILLLALVWGAIVLYLHYKQVTD